MQYFGFPSGDIDEAIKTLFENGGLPATPFATKALMTASALVDGQYAQVTDGGADNGLYLKTAGVWVKSDYDPAEQAKVYTDEFIDEITKIETGKNIYNKQNDVQGEYVNTNGVLRLVAGWSRSEYIPVKQGETYTISATAKRGGMAFYSSKNESGYIADSFDKSSGNLTVTAPVGAKYLLINIDSDTIASKNVQVEVGSTATSYEPFVGKDVIRTEVLPSNIATNESVNTAINLIPDKPYEMRQQSENIFNESLIVDGEYLASSDGRVVSGAGWSRSNAIPIVAGEKYTLSGQRARKGLAFFADSSNLSTPVFYSVDASNPLTVTAPVGANFIVFNIESATAKGYSELMLQRGALATKYEPFGTSLKIDSSYLSGNGVSSGDASFKVVGNTATLSAGIFKLDLLLTRPQSHASSIVLNFSQDFVDGVLMRSPGDDAAPVRMDGTTVGANHGYNRTLITTTHSKTNADVGSVWTDGAKEFVLIEVLTGKLVVTARADNASLSANSLTHVSGATNTAAITSATKENVQWYPSIKNRQLFVTVDGARVDISQGIDVNFSDNVTFHESYEIMAKSDMVEWVVANGGKELTEYDAAGSVLCNYSYAFDKDIGCTIYASLTALKEVRFGDWMVTQSYPLINTNRKYYVPKTAPFLQDSINYNFTNLQAMPSAITSSIFFDSSKNEVGANPVDRLVQFSGDVGYATGYLPLFDAEPTKRPTNASNKYMEVRGSSLKIYPRLIDSEKDTLVVGDSFSAIAYRKYFKKDNSRTAKYIVRSNVADFLYLDWHSAKTDLIELHEDLIGREFTVHEKSSNVTLLSAFATNNIVVKVDDTKSYGYLVLRFDR